MSAISFFATSKRSACDRCRKQKLRCPANDGTAQSSCERCIRAGIPCVTSYTKPRGRQQKHSISPDNTLCTTGQDTIVGQENALKPTESILSTDSRSSAPETIDSVATDMRQSWSLLEEQCHLAAMSEYGSEKMSQGQDENFTGFWYKDFDSDAHIDMSDFSQTAYSMDMSSIFPGGQDHHNIECGTDLLQRIDCDTRLCQLNLDLCRQLKTHLLGSTTTSGSPVQSPCSNTSNALCSVLQSTVAYIYILQCLSNRTEPRPDSRCQPTAPTTTNTHDSETSSTNLAFFSVLSLTSCFFRIVDLFDMLLSQLAQELSKQSPSLGTSAASSTLSTIHILPELNFAGLPVHEVSLQVKTLVLAITHYFETMERLLGLPADLRVSERREDNVHGLLSANWMGILSAGKKERCEGMEWCGSKENGATSIESLRANIRGLIKVA